MEKMHSLLKRQLRKNFGEGFVAPREWENFLEAVNNAYIDSDTDRAMLERAYDLSSHDLIRANYELRAVFQAIPDLLFRLDSDGVILDCKAGNMTDLYLPPSKLTGKHIQDVRPEAVADKFTKAIEEAKTTKSVVSFDYSLSLYGNDFFYDARLIPMPGKNFVAIVQNVTARKNAEKELRKLTLAIEQSPVSVLITDKKGSIEYVNPKFTRISGYSLQEVMGQNPRIFRSGNQSAKLYAELWDTILSGREWHGELCNKKKSGETYWEFVSISPIRDDVGEITHFIAIKEDITDRKKAAEELQRAKEAAEVANKAKSSFLATVSHELRTPMNAITGLAHLLQKAELNPDHRNYVDKIMASSATLLRTINDIIDFSKIWSGSVELEKIDFNLENLMNSIAVGMSSANRRNVRVTFRVADNVPHQIKGSPRTLKQVINHLLDNALKFTESGEIRISAELEQMLQKHAVIRFSVMDTGVGMTGEQVSNIFQPFTQADGSTTRKFGGTGLGLAISQQLVKLMGGTIEVKSKPDKGSEFIFKAEFGIEEEQAAVAGKKPEGIENIPLAPEKKSEGIWGSCVLLVEDNEINQEVARAFLESEGLVIDIAGNGQQALQMVEKKSYAAVLMDIWMPDMDGFEATQKIRRLPGMDSLPVIAMTADTMGGNLSNIYKAGMNDCIFKPIDVKKLRSVLSRWILSGKGTGGDSKSVSVPKADAPSENKPAVDFDSALLRIGSDRALYIRLLTRFRDDHEREINEIADAFARNDIESAGRLAHALKGVAGNIGADGLMSAMHEIELTIKQGNPEREKIDLLLKAASMCMHSVMNAISRYISGSDEGPDKSDQTGSAQSAPENVEIWPKLNHLQYHLEEYNVESALVFEEVKRLLRPYGISTELKQIESAIVKYDFEAAAQKLKDLYSVLHIPKGHING